MLRDTKSINMGHVSTCPQPDGTIAFYFGDTTVIARELIDKNGRKQLFPVRGDQVAHGEWYDLDKNDVIAYCELLAIQQNFNYSEDSKKNMQRKST